MLLSFEALFNKLAMHRIAISAFKKENFGQQNVGKFLVICQICQDFLPPKFCIVWYLQKGVSFNQLIINFFNGAKKNVKKIGHF